MIRMSPHEVLLEKDERLTVTFADKPDTIIEIGADATVRRRQ